MRPLVVMPCFCPTLEMETGTLLMRRMREETSLDDEQAFSLHLYLIVPVRKHRHLVISLIRPVTTEPLPVS